MGIGKRGGHDHRAAGERQERQSHADGAHDREQHQQYAERGAAFQQYRTLADARPSDGEPQGPSIARYHRRHQHAVAARVGVQERPERPPASAR